MAKIWCGHFDSTVDDEREMLAADWAAYIRSLITNGVRNLGSNLLVTAGEGLTLKALAGIANAEGYLLIITPDINGDYVEAMLEDAHPTHARIDRVVVRLDLRPQIRLIGIHTITGVASASPVPPELTRNAEIYELSLARVRVGRGVVAIDPNDITDERAITELCGLMNSILGLDSTVWQEQFDAFMARIMAQEDAFLSLHGERFDTQLTEQQSEWAEQMETQFTTQSTEFNTRQTEIQTWYDNARVDIAALQTFDFDNLASMPGVEFLVGRHGSVTTATIAKSGGSLVAKRTMARETGGVIVTTLTRYEEDGTTVRSVTTVRLWRTVTGEIKGEVSA